MTKPSPSGNVCQFFFCLALRSFDYVSELWGVFKRVVDNFHWRDFLGINVA